jgi:hypothetical protein
MGSCRSGKGGAGTATLRSGTTPPSAGEIPEPAMLAFAGSPTAEPGPPSAVTKHREIRSARQTANMES